MEHDATLLSAAPAAKLMFRRVVLTLVLGLTLGGCETYLPSQPRFNSTILLPKGHLDGDPGTVVRTPTLYKSSIIQPVPLSCERAEAPGTTRRDRDACIVDLETDIDGAFREYEIQLQSDIAKTNSLLNVTGIALSAASTAVAGASAKTILSAIGTGVGGVRTSISEDFLFKSTLQTLASQMVADRAKIAARISSSSRADIDGYSIHEAYRDLLDYYYAGTLLGALQSINADAGAKATSCTAAAQTAQASAKGLASGNQESSDSAGKGSACGAVTFAYNYGQSGQDLNKIWRPDGVHFDLTAEAKLKACIAKLKITVDLATLVYGSPDIDKNRVMGCYQSS